MQDINMTIGNVIKVR